MKENYSRRDFDSCVDIGCWEKQMKGENSIEGYLIIV